MENRRTISFAEVQYREPDLTYYLKDNLRKMTQFFSYAANSLYNSLWSTFSFDQIDYKNFKKIIRPIVASGVAFIVGDAITAMIQKQNEFDENDFIIKTIIGTCILAMSSFQRITDCKPKSARIRSALIASEVLAVTYLYTSSFKGARLLTQDSMSENWSVVSSLGISTLVIPGIFSYSSETLQKMLIKWEKRQGSQRANTVCNPAGATVVANTYFLANRFLVSELMLIPRLFQLGLISDNIFNAINVIKQFRNLPALLADVGPQVIKKVLSQLEKVRLDFQYNTAEEKVLVFEDGELILKPKARHKLRTKDLVHCHDQFDFNSVKVAGEVFAFKRDQHGNFTLEPEEKEFGVCLEAKNGEKNIIKLKSNTTWKTPFNYVELDAVHKGKQAGILTGTRLNLFGDKNFFIRIKEEMATPSLSGYEKTAVINSIITAHKTKCVQYSLLSALALTILVKRDFVPLNFLANYSNLLFNLLQMPIPFSEGVLREMVNAKLMKELNQHQNRPIQTIQALRATDGCNALAGYYPDKFPAGTVLITDKTGTLTTSRMDVLGFWTDEMKPNDRTYSHARNKIAAIAKIFAACFTCNEKEIEPEEYAILQYLNKTLKTDVLTFESIGKDHFKKTIVLDDKPTKVTTLHLGLFRSLGGRLTLVTEGERQYLYFCGIPREKLNEAKAAASYKLMETRTGTLTRDWCLASTPITAEDYKIITELFYKNEPQQIENYLCKETKLASQFKHQCTFHIDNPVKKGAEKLIDNCRAINVPVFIATGDTPKAAENIAAVLCSAHCNQITTLTPETLSQWQNHDFTRPSTLIFAVNNKDISEEMLGLLDQFMLLPAATRPVIIFAGMRAVDKGTLAEHFKNKGFFVIANGDGSNDVEMMKHANLVFAHLTENGTYAADVEQFADLNDDQVRNLFQLPDASFYELFDVHLKEGSRFKQHFNRLANAQENPSKALQLKTSKIAFELAPALGIADAKEMPNYHLFSMGYDLLWLLESFLVIDANTDSPSDNQHLERSNFRPHYFLITTLFANALCWFNYYNSGEATNWQTMFGMLAVLPLVLNSVFSAYGHVRDETHPPKLTEDKGKTSRWGIFKNCRRKTVHEKNNIPKLEFKSTA